MLLVMSRSELLARVASTNRLARSTARRFVAGETLDEALHAVGILNAGGLLATLDLLGENVTTEAEARTTADAYLDMLVRIRAAGASSSVSVKPTSLGLDVSEVLASDLVERIAAEGAAAGLGELASVARDDAPGGWGPARYYRFPGALGTIGVISPLSHHFCGECNRLRLTAVGKLRTCLFSDDEIDVRTVLRAGTDADVRDVIRQALAAKPEGHHMQLGTVRRMSQIGG